MTSIVFYKFKNSISQESINFDGSIIQIGDVKRLIALKRGLGVEGAAELILSDPNTGDEYLDDTKAIPRNSLVLVKRTPVARLQPLQAGATTTAAPPPKSTSLHHSTAPQNNNDEFGGDYFSEKPTAAVVGAEEDAALQNLLAGTAATWKREVRQGTVRGRGRGRGGRGGGGSAAATVPPDYRCPRCEEIGAHWLNDCPTHGNPEFDKRKIRPPVGIPMTRLARSQEGGLVLPDGGTGTLLANEDAFAREIMGMGGMGSSTGVIINGDGGRNGEKNEEQEVLALPPAAPPAAGAEDGHGGDTETGKEEMITRTEGRKDTGDLGSGEETVAPAAATTVATAAEPPTTTTITTPTSMDDRKFVEKYIQAPTLPRGPPEFITLAFNTDNPVDEEEFKEIQTKWRSRFKLPPLSIRAGVSGASGGGGGGESAVTRSSRERSQSRSRHRHRSSRSPSASGGERKKRSGRSKSRSRSRSRRSKSREGHGRRSKRSHKSRRRTKSRSKKHRHSSKDRSRSRSRSRSRRSKHRISRHSSRERSSKSRHRHVDNGEEERKKSVEIGEPSGGDVNGGKNGDGGGGAGNDNKAAAPEDEVQLELDI